MRAFVDMTNVVAEYSNDHLGLLQRCGGYYECPKDSAGKRLGPLVAYRGEYEAGKRFVGDVYVNFSKAEQFPRVVRHFGHLLLEQLVLRNELCRIDVFCGAPEGGKCLADKLAMMTARKYVYPEKKDGPLQWGRHTICTGERVAIVEDVSNNFSTTEKMVKLILDTEGIPVLIISFLNRSLTIDDVWSKDDFPELPVLSLVRKKIHEYRQNNPSVIADVDAGNVVWDVKSQWALLEQVMRDASA